jgi:succinyl-CoA synthetase alpha subunit
MQLSATSPVIIQGITEPFGRYWTKKMKAYGTKIVAGISAGQGAQTWEDIPMFDLVENAISEVGIVDTTIIFDPPYQVLDAALEAINAGINHIILASHQVPPLDIVRLLKKAHIANISILGPGQAGLIIPEKALFGSIEPQHYTAGAVGIISRATSLTDEIAGNLTQGKLGQSLAVNLGDEGIIGLSFRDWLEFLDHDPDTEVIVLIGQPRSSEEEVAADYIANVMQKPVIAYLAGQSTPADKPRGDAAVMIAAQLSGTLDNTSNTSQKVSALKKAKVLIATRPSQIPDLVKKALKK